MIQNTLEGEAEKEGNIMVLLISHHQFLLVVVIVSLNEETWSDNRAIYDNHHPYSIRVAGGSLFALLRD